MKTDDIATANFSVSERRRTIVTKRLKYGMLDVLLNVLVHTDLALMMEEVRTSETSVNFNVITRHYIPEDSKLHTCRRENLKCQISCVRNNGDSPNVYV
jgi:hypothetical protein